MTDFDVWVKAITNRRNEHRYWAKRLNEGLSDTNTLVADVLDDLLRSQGAWTEPPEFEV